MLTKEPSEITAWDVVQAVDPIGRIESCPLGIESHSGKLCPLHQRLDQLLASIEQALRETKLDELLGERTGNSPLCDEADVVDVIPLDLSIPSKKK